jgi:hypothetical protein
MKVDRVRANHSLRLTASQGTPNIPFHWFQLLGSYRQAQKKEIIAWLSVRSKEKTNECDQASVGIKKIKRKANRLMLDHGNVGLHFPFSLSCGQSNNNK